MSFHLCFFPGAEEGICHFCRRTDGEIQGILQTGGSYFQPLSWSIRMKVTLGAARGLAFLRSCEPEVIYWDFKTSNILLDPFIMQLLSSFKASWFHVTSWHDHSHAVHLISFVSIGRITVQNFLCWPGMLQPNRRVMFPFGWWGPMDMQLQSILLLVLFVLL